MIAYTLRHVYCCSQQIEYYFCYLCHLTYHAMYRAKQKYHLYYWDEQDREQEAMIVLFQLIHQFQDKRSWKNQDFERVFFSYFHHSLSNHFLNEWRYERAAKRNVNQTMTWIEQESLTYCEVDTYEAIVTQLWWQQSICTIATYEVCQLLLSRLEGKSLRTCSKELHRGTKYTTMLLEQIKEQLQ